MLVSNQLSENATKKTVLTTALPFLSLGRFLSPAADDGHVLDLIILFSWSRRFQTVLLLSVILTDHLLNHAIQTLRTSVSLCDLCLSGLSG